MIKYIVMKTSTRKIAFLLLLSLQTLAAQVTLTSGSWTNNGATVPFIDMTSFGQSGVFALATSTSVILTDSNTSFAGEGSAPPNLIPSGVQGNAYGFSLFPATTINPATATVADFNIAGENGSSGDVILTFGNVSNLDFVAYTGGEMKGYVYNSTNSTLSITLSAVTAAGSENNAGGGQTLLGLVIVTGANTGYGGAVFRTDMYWGDIKMQSSDLSYGDTSALPGSNFSGNDGDMVNFDYYIKQSVLENLGQSPVTDIDKCKFRFKKANGTEVDPTITVKYYTTDGNGTTWNNNETPDGTTTFDFDGGGVDNYVNASVQNDSWSSANGYMYGQQPLGIDTNLVDKIAIYAQKGRIFIASGNEKIKSSDVYQLDGKKLISTQKPVIEVERGIYIVNVSTNNGTKSAKVFVKQGFQFLDVN